MTTFAVGSSVSIKPGERDEEIGLDLSGWQGWVIEIDDEYGDLLVRWDSQTIANTPDWAIKQYLVDDGQDWTAMYLEPEVLQLAEPRDEKDDWLTAVAQRYQALGIDPSALLGSVMSNLLDGDEDDDSDEDEQPWPLFDLEALCQEWEIPAKERASIQRSLARGLGNYYYGIHGYYKHGKLPEELIPETMGIPYIAGYGILEILSHRQIRQATKRQFCLTAVANIDASEQQGIPYGLLTILSYLATYDQLNIALFSFSLMALTLSDYGIFRRPMWMAGTTKESLIVLADWLLMQSEMPDEERLWWIWTLITRCGDNPHLGKPLALHWLNHPAVPDDTKAELCWSWLTDKKAAGAPPLAWKLMTAYQGGDLDQMKQLLQAANIDPAMAPLPLPDEMLPSPDSKEGFFYRLFNNPTYFLMPGYLKRLAVPGLVRFGEDVDVVADMFWDAKNEDYYTDALNNGVADAIKEFHGRLAPDVLRRLIERGMDYSSAQTRKTFYALSTQFYGQEFLPKALQDNASSIRTWAAKQLQKKK